ncbi:DNA polymerase III subunit delta [Fictibacillus sp. Mic-4]|uniref:DNA polymerase III subunit delta n=1 Tax=Fictibacillus TaxID=1329200 RepID=UPI000418266D|nr:DNA polymerase III subunit delta [Fictibacillus gelatini]
MSLSNIVKKLKQQKVAPFYLITGTEGYIIDEALSSIEKAVLNDEEKDFNLSVYDYQETPIQVAVEDAETLPFMGERRIVILKNAIFLTGAKEKSKVEHDLTSFEQYVNHPVDYTIFIIVAPYEKLDERKKIVKLLKARSEMINASSVGHDAASDWAKNRAAEQNVQMENDAAQFLISKIGTELSLLAQEIDKMVLYVGENGVISVDTVNELVSRTLEEDIFSLIDDIVHKRIDQALRTFYDLLIQNEEPIKILSLMARQFRIIFGVKELSQRGYGEKQIASMLKLHPYVVKLAGGQARLFTEKELLSILDRLAEADYEMKTGKMDKVLLLELIIMEMNHVKSNGA